MKVELKRDNRAWSGNNYVAFQKHLLTHRNIWWYRGLSLCGTVLKFLCGSSGRKLKVYLRLEWFRLTTSRTIHNLALSPYRSQ